MLRLDSSEMLPGSQKGEETGEENGETQQVTYPVLGWSFKYEDRRRYSGFDHFALILPNNPQYQLGR